MDDWINERNHRNPGLFFRDQDITPMEQQNFAAQFAEPAGSALRSG